MVIIDEYTRECLSILVARRLRSQNVLDNLYELFIKRGIPEYIRSDNGPEFAVKVEREWLVDIGVSTLFIEPGSPWENGYAESFIGKFGNELLNGEIFYTLLEAKVITANWRREYNQLRPHSSLGCRPPTPAAVLRSVAYLISLTLQFLHISSASSIIGPNIIPSLSLIQCMNFHFLIL